MTIGAAEDLQRRALDDVRAFFQTYYHPAQRVARARRRHRRRATRSRSRREYFGELAAGPRAAAGRRAGAAARTARRGSCSRIASSCRGSTSRGIRRRCSPTTTPSWISSPTCSASGKTSRLYRTLVYEQRSRPRWPASQNSRELGGFFQIVATAAPGRTLAELEAAIARRARDARAPTGPTADEMERCLAQAEAHFVYRLQTVGGFGGKSDQLNAYNVFLGDPGYFDRDLARYRRPTPRRCSAPRATGSAPRTRRAQRRAARPRRAGARRLSKPVSVSVMPRRSIAPAALGPEPAFRFPAIAASGGSPTASASGRSSTARCRSSRCWCSCRAARAADPADRPGLAAITGDLLDEGCGDLDALALHEALGRIGAQLDTEIGSDATRSSALTTLERFAAPSLALLADMIMRPRLDASDFDRVRELRLNRLVQLRDMPPARRRARVHRSCCTATHPYGHLPIGSEASLAAMTRATRCARSIGGCTPRRA